MLLGLGLKTHCQTSHVPTQPDPLALLSLLLLPGMQAKEAEQAAGVAKDQLRKTEAEVRGSCRQNAPAGHQQQHATLDHSCTCPHSCPCG